MYYIQGISLHVLVIIVVENIQSFHKNRDIHKKTFSGFHS